MNGDEYGLRWREFVGKSGGGALTTKTKWFKNAEARRRFAERICEHDGFVEFVAWSDPKVTVH